MIKSHSNPVTWITDHISHCFSDSNKSVVLCSLTAVSSTKKKEKAIRALAGWDYERGRHLPVLQREKSRQRDGHKNTKKHEWDGRSCTGEFTDITTLNVTYFFNRCQKIKCSSGTLRQNKEKHGSPDSVFSRTVKNDQLVQATGSIHVMINATSVQMDQ